MLDKLVAKRLIAVGDPWQSIYAFRGADTGSMPRLKRRFSMKEMTLSMTFRCPTRGVENVKWRVPHYRAAPWATEGEIFDLTHAETADGKEWKASGSAIICRNNAPLMGVALKLLQYGVGCRLLGSDLGPGLIRTLKKLCNENMEAKQAEALVAIDEWEETMLKKRKNQGTVHDKADCLRVFVDFGATLGAAVAYAEHLFKTDGPIQLMSGHKAKGLEFDVVYHLDPWLVPSKWATEGEAREQELNLKYVIETRFKLKLYKVLSTDLRQ
jgi:superfamily I DNA/RNA helicase